MEKILTFVRHAKSSWDLEVSDRDRPLAMRGIQDAHKMAEHLSGHIGIPDRILSSPANRALHTCIIYVRTLGFDLGIVQISELMYDFSGNTVLKQIQMLDPAWDHVMLFGHNEAFTTLVNSLGDKVIDNVPTAACVQIVFPVNSWAQAGSGHTKLFTYPKQLA